MDRNLLSRFTQPSRTRRCSWGISLGSWEMQQHLPKIPNASYNTPGTTKLSATSKASAESPERAALTPPAGMPRWIPALAPAACGSRARGRPERAGAGARWGGSHGASLGSPRQIISYLQPLPPRRSPLTSFTQPRRLEPTAADVWLLSTARHIGTPARRRRARLAPPPPKNPFIILIWERHTQKPAASSTAAPQPPYGIKPARKRGLGIGWTVNLFKGL